MKLALSAVLLAAALPVLAQQQSDADVSRLAVRAAVRDALVHDGRRLTPAQVAIAETRIGGGHSSMEMYATKFYGDVIAEELVESYRAVAGSPENVSVAEAGETPVLDLHKFEAGRSYGWERLHDKYPHIRAVVRISPIAFDSTQTYGVVRCEIVTSHRSERAVIMSLEAENGTWKHKRSMVGDLWN